MCKTGWNLDFIQFIFAEKSFLDEIFLSFLVGFIELAHNYLGNI